MPRELLKPMGSCSLHNKDDGIVKLIDFITAMNTIKDTLNLYFDHTHTPIIGFYWNPGRMSTVDKDNTAPDYRVSTLAEIRQNTWNKAFVIGAHFSIKYQKDGRELFISIKVEAKGECSNKVSCHFFGIGGADEDIGAVMNKITAASQTCFIIKNEAADHNYGE